LATGKITKRSVEAVPPPEPGKREHLWDSTLKGFGVMVTDKGVRSYLVQYRIGGRGNPTRRVTIGQHGSPWTAEKARVRAADLLEQVRQKVDPFDAERDRVKQGREQKRVEEAARQEIASLGFSTFADRFVTRYAKVEQPRTWRDTESIVRRDLKPYFADTPLPAIKPVSIFQLLEMVQERGDSAAIKAYRTLRSLFGYAVTQHVLPASPMANMKPPARASKRERALTDAELRLVWQAASNLNYPFGSLVQLLILTGQRLREVAELPWAELDLASSRWLIPAERAKNNTNHLVPLGTDAKALIDGLPRINSTGPNGRSLFAFTTTGDTPVSGFSKAKKRLDARMLALALKEARNAGASDEQLEAVTMAPWRLHDLRRTFASGCQRLGVKLEVSEAILNHVSGTRSGIAGVYHVYRYEDEKREAMLAWERFVGALVADTKAAPEVIDAKVAH